MNRNDDHDDDEEEFSDDSDFIPSDAEDDEIEDENQKQIEKQKEEQKEKEKEKEKENQKKIGADLWKWMNSDQDKGQNNSDNKANNKADIIKSGESVDNKVRKKIVKEMYDYAGEKIVLEKEVIIKDDGKKRGLDQIIDDLDKNKLRKMNTLDKSRLDWGKHVAKAGLEDELERNRSSGYLEKLSFLERTSTKSEEYSRQQQFKKLKF